MNLRPWRRRSLWHDFRCRLRGFYHRRIVAVFQLHRSRLPPPGFDFGHHSLGNFLIVVPRNSDERFSF